MASILNASLSSGLVATGDTSGIIQLQSNGAQTVNVATNGIITNTFNSANGLVPGYQYYRLNSGVVGSNATGNQSALGVGVTLASSTIYEFETLIVIYKTAGTTSHSISFGFGGTATNNNILYYGVNNNDTSFPISYTGGTVGSINNTASMQVITNPITNATWATVISNKGTISVNSGGTFIPQYSLSAAPGGAYTTQAGSYFKIAPLGASGSNISIGSWA